MIIQYKLERGAALQSLERLLGSRTVGGTVLTMAQMPLSRMTVILILFCRSVMLCTIARSLAFMSYYTCITPWLRAPLHNIRRFYLPRNARQSPCAAVYYTLFSPKGIRPIKVLNCQLTFWQHRHPFVLRTLLTAIHSRCRCYGFSAKSRRRVS